MAMWSGGSQHNIKREIDKYHLSKAAQWHCHKHFRDGKIYITHHDRNVAKTLGVWKTFIEVYVYDDTPSIREVLENVDEERCIWLRLDLLEDYEIDVGSPSGKYVPPQLVERLDALGIEYEVFVETIDNDMVLSCIHTKDKKNLDDLRLIVKMSDE